MVSENLKDFTRQIVSCSDLEEEIFRFYQSVAKKMDSPELRGQIVSIGYDSLKHSMTVKEIVKTVEKTELNLHNRPKVLTELTEEVAEISKQINELSCLSTEEFIDVFKALTDLEDRLAEIYLNICQPKILRAVANELEIGAPVNLKSLTKIFEDIIRDKQMHREVLFDIRYCFASQEQRARSSAPVVRYTNPDRWMPPQAF